MLILALDTSTRGGSCAVARDDELLGERAGDPSASHATQLPGLLMALLDESGVPLSAVDLYAVAVGPGSFTGLRVGIAAMQGLAFAAGAPLVGVSTFDALASVSRCGARVATWVDAWRGEIYAALYDAGQEIEGPTVEHPEAVLARLTTSPTCFVGDGAVTYARLIHDRLGQTGRIADPPAPRLAGTVARLAAGAARRGELPPPHAIRPLYVRRPDAELARDARTVR